MTELHDLLERAAGPHVAPTSVDLDADVARGVRALRRRRTGVVGGALTAAVAAAAIPVALGGGWGTGAGAVAPGGTGGPAGKASPTTSQEAMARQKEALKQAADSSASTAAQDAAKAAALKVALAAAQSPWRADGKPVPIHTYRGAPVDGSYQPGLVPEGAVIQGGNAYRLTISRPGDPDTNPDSFAGKVVVMLSGRTAPNGPEVQVSEALSKIVVVPLDHPVSGATSLAVQYPPGIGWTDSEAISFASAVRVLSTAKDPKG